MKIRVRVYGMVHDEIGQRELNYQLPKGSTIGDLLKEMLSAFPVLNEMVYNEKGEYRNYLEIAVNHVAVLDISKVLSDNDFVQVMPPIGGG